MSDDDLKPIDKDKLQIESDDEQQLISPNRGFVFQDKPKQKRNQSEFFLTYLKEMNLGDNINFQYQPPYLGHQTINRFTKLNITYHPQIFKYVNIQIEQCTNQCTVMELKVELGFFTLKINILNKLDMIIQNASKPNIQSCFEINGCFGKILYRFWGRGSIDQNNFISNYQRFSQYFVQKIFYFQKLSTTENGIEYCYKKIHTTILQYCFGKIAYALEIGPQIQLGFGFDLVCYKNGILLFMERCRTLKSSDYANSLETVEKELKQALVLFHSLKFIHNDIKFDNIMFSERLNKIVFIDFGLSELVKQKLGKKTQSLFKGSYYFVSEQMKSLIVKNNGHVDLYWNDLYCLKKSIEFMQGNNQQKDLIHFRSQSLELSDIHNAEVYVPQLNSSRRQSQFHESKELTEGSSMIPSKQQEAISVFNHADAQLVQYQIFYLLFKKNIQLFRICLSPQNYISQSLRIYLMNSVMKFLQQLQGCPIYDQIYYENYSNYKYNIEYENLKYSQQQQQPTAQTSSPIKSGSYQKIGKRYLKLNTKNGLVSHYIENSWIAVFDQISQKIYQLTINKYDSTLIKNYIDFTQCLQHFNDQAELVQQNLCNILVYALTIPINQQKEIRRITKKMIRMFKNAALALIDEGFIQEKLNISKQSRGQSELQLKKQLIEHIQQITQSNKQLFLVPGNIQNQLQSISYMLVNRIIEKYIFKQEFIRVIQSKQINLFINPKKIHSTISNTSTSQKIRLLLYMNYCDHYDYKNAYRVLEEIQSTFNQHYIVQTELYCLAVYLKMFINSINFRCGYDLLTRLKYLATIFKKEINSYQHNNFSQSNKNKKKSKKVSSIYDFQTNEDYIDYFIKYLQLQIIVNKGLGDYNAQQLQKQLLELQVQCYKYYLFHGDKMLKFQIQSQFVIIKMMIYDQIHSFQQGLALGKKLYNFYTRGMNDRQVGSKLLFRSYFYLGVEQKRVNSRKLVPCVEDRELNQIEEFKKYSANFEKLLKKEKLEIKFIQNYTDFQQYQTTQCIIDFDQIIAVIKSIESDIKIFTSQETLRISSMMTLFVVTFTLQLEFLYQKIIHQVKGLIDKQIKVSFETKFYLETMMILNEIAEDIIGIIFEQKKTIAKDILQYFWSNYRDYVYLIFSDRKQTYPTSFWILKIIVEQKYYSMDPLDMAQRYKTELSILETLDRESSMESGFKHLNFVIQFFIKLSFYQINLEHKIISSIQERQDYFLDILKKCVQTIVGTKRRYLLLFYAKFTQSCIKIFYQNQYFHSIFFLFQVIASFVKKFPGQKNMDIFCKLSNVFQKLEVSEQFVLTISQIVADKMIEKELQSQFPQIVTFFIILCTKIMTLNFNSVLKSEWFLKKITFQFQRLSRYMKKKFLPKYLNLFGQFYERKKNRAKQFQMKMKFLRVLKLQDSIQEKWKKYKNCVQFLEQRLNLKNRLNEQKFTQKIVAQMFHLKLRKLYFASLITEPQPPIDRLSKMEIFH